MIRFRHALAIAALLASPVAFAQTAPASVKSIQLSKVVLDPEIAKDKQKVKVGTICLFAGEPLNFGTSERTLDKERFERNFSTTMNTRGFKVVAKATNMFESEDNGADIDFLIGATFRIESVDICDSVSGIKGGMTVTVEWQIYDRARKQVVETISTPGTARIEKFAPSGLVLLIDQAFASSLEKLIEQGTMAKHLGAPVTS